ncbi:hypothetical protein BR93DRAFT_958404 [Coniochaeta sp. PMI_546]|nr:hypothetical protein BR93DRAFT_958404 [Coniochaeta sp. PMI_546]
MSSNNDASSTTRGHEARDEKTSNRKTTYAPAVTKEVVKPVVHEQIEEHITRETHTHDVYTKILPVRDVEVLPARHWVPGPDGRLIQVDEKDVYSGAAWSQGQASTAGFTQTQQANLEHMNHGTVDQPRESSSTQFADTVKHTSINQPKVIPAQVKQVYQTQVHQPELDQRKTSQIKGSPIMNGASARDTTIRFTKGKRMTAMFTELVGNPPTNIRWRHIRGPNIRRRVIS